MKDISLRILDMECAACVARLDRALEKLPGVQRAAVNYTAALALITYDEGVTDLAAIAARVKRAGFRVPVEEQDLLPAEADAAKTAAAADALRAVFGVKELAKGVWHEGQFIKGIDWIDWALLLDLPAVAIPACMTAIKKRREFKQNLLEAGEEA